MEIAGKKIIITGGAKGIGKNLVEKLIDKDGIICVLDMDEAALQVISTEIPSVFCKKCDVTDPRSVENAVLEFTGIHGPVDVLVNAAGLVHDSPLISISGGLKKHNLELWNQIIAVNLTGVFIVSACVAEQMIKNRTKGLIINVSSISAQGNAGQSAYSAAKAGVTALTRTWAKELNGLNIRVAGIAPGFTKTETVLAIMNEKIINEWTRKIPVKRMAEPSEIAEGIVFIIRNDFFNAKILELDGGLVL